MTENENDTESVFDKIGGVEGTTDTETDESEESMDPLMIKIAGESIENEENALQTMDENPEEKDTESETEETEVGLKDTENVSDETDDLAIDDESEDSADEEETEMNEAGEDSALTEDEGETVEDNEIAAENENEEDEAEEIGNEESATVFLTSDDIYVAQLTEDETYELVERLSEDEPMVEEASERGARRMNVKANPAMLTSRTGYVAFDIDLTNDELNEAGKYIVPVMLSVPVSLAEDGESVKDVVLYHFTEEGLQTEKIVDYTIEDGALTSFVFETNGFSTYVLKYTVEFHNGDEEVVIKGGSQILLSDLLVLLNFDDPDVSKIESVSFSDPDLIQVEEVSGIVMVNGVAVDAGEHNFLITSLRPFTSQEQMIIIYYNSEDVVEIAVTDDQTDGVWNLADTDNTQSLHVTAESSVLENEQERDAAFKLTFTYTLEEDVVKAIDQYDGNFSLVYDLNSTVSGSPLGAIRNNTNGVISIGSRKIGNYVVKDNVVTLNFTDPSYFDGRTSFTGYFSLTVETSETELGTNNEWTYEFPGTSDTVLIHYKNTVEDGTKSVYSTQDADGNYTLHYTANINVNSDLDSMTFTDTLTGQQTLDASSVKSGGQSVSVTTTGNSFTFDVASALGTSGVAKGSYQVTYDTKVTADQLKAMQADKSTETNKADWKVNGNKDVPGG